MTIKEKLREYRTMRRRLRCIEAEIEVLQGKIDGLKSIGDFAGTDSKSSWHISKVGKVVSALAERCEEYDREGERIKAGMQDVEAMVDLLTGDERVVAFRYYLDGNTFEEIGRDLNYSESWSRKKNRRALETLGKSLGER